jgi:flagellar hook assembly protein FlgD
VKINIYNVRGQVVLNIVDEEKAPGRYTATWDGTTAGGSKVPSGVYFYRMEARGYRATKKMLVIQ